MQAAIFAQRSSVAAAKPHSAPGMATHIHGIKGRKRPLELGYQRSPHKSSKTGRVSLSPLSEVEELPMRTVSTNSTSSMSSSENLGTPSIPSDSVSPLTSTDEETSRLRSSRPIDFADSLLDLPDRLSVMVQLDSTAYCCHDYLCGSRAEIESARETSPTSLNEFQMKEDRRHKGTVYSEWRERMAEWSYQVVDHFGYNREVVALSMSFFDRYLSSWSTDTVDSMREFQLLSASTLFLACKLHYNTNEDCSRPQQGQLGASTLAKLSRGYFTAEQVEATEILILSHLGWRVHPPTALAFLKHLLLLLPCDARTPHERGQLEAKSNFLLELSVMDGAFVGYKRHTIALAAILCSFNLSGERRQLYADTVYNATSLKFNTEEIVECIDRLIKISIANGK